MEKIPKRLRMSPRIEECAVIILEKSGDPMSLENIFEEVLKMRPVGGKTPRKTIYSILYKSERIIRLDNGLFDLKERADKKG